MNDVVFVFQNHALTWLNISLFFAGFVSFLLLIVTFLLIRSRRDLKIEAAASTERAYEMDDKIAEMARIQAELTGRMQTMAELFGNRQSDVMRTINERMDGLQQRFGQGLESTTRHQSEQLSKLNERLGLIDVAQKNLTALTGEVVNLRDVLSNKQTRGAYGQGRMEAIIRDGLPGGAYEFQPTLSNRTRPDCMVKLPGDPRGLVIDAKFPLEGFTAFRESRSDADKTRATSRVKADVMSHIKDLSEKYLIPGETQDIAMMFVPAESLYADLQEHFEEVVQKAHRARVIIVSPSLLTLSIQVLQALVRDGRIRDEARIIQIEVQKILEDVSRLNDRVNKLDTHFRQVQDDVGFIKTSSDKITKRGQKIASLEFEDGETEARAELLRAQGRTLRAVE